MGSEWDPQYCQGSSACNLGLRLTCVSVCIDMLLSWP